MLNALLNIVGKRPAADEQSPVPAQRTPHEARLRVLLAEDNEANQMFAVRVLEKRGHTVVVAANGKEALAALAGCSPSRPFDVVLMDVQMPEMGGFEATAQIRNRERSAGGHVPIIAMTANALKGDQERCLAAGMDGYVSKPVRPQELLSAVESAAPRAPSGGDAPQPKAAAGALDKSALLAHFGGDADLMREIAQILQKNIPGHMVRILKAVQESNGAELQHAAHSLKGAVGHFSAPAYESAQELEQMGGENNLENAERAYAELETVIVEIKPALAEIAGGS